MEDQLMAMCYGVEFLAPICCCYMWLHSALNPNLVIGVASS